MEKRRRSSQSDNNEDLVETTARKTKTRRVRKGETPVQILLDATQVLNLLCGGKRAITAEESINDVMESNLLVGGAVGKVSFAHGVSHVLRFERRQNGPRKGWIEDLRTRVESLEARLLETVILEVPSHSAAILSRLTEEDIRVGTRMGNGPRNYIDDSLSRLHATLESFAEILEHRRQYSASKAALELDIFQDLEPLPPVEILNDLIGRYFTFIWEFPDVQPGYRMIDPEVFSSSFSKQHPLLIYSMMSTSAADRGFSHPDRLKISASLLARCKRVLADSLESPYRGVSVVQALLVFCRGLHAQHIER
ncbi:hypothetical protein HDU93_001669, partial [Gonapodya sp. JEL0774]